MIPNEAHFPSCMDSQNVVFYDTLHGDVRSKKDTPVLSRVVLRKDGFTAMEGGNERGEFTPPPLTFEGEALHLNLNTSSLGILRVEIQNTEGEPIEGYTLDDCDRVHTANTIDRVVTFNSDSDLSELAGRSGCGSSCCTM